MRKIDRFEAHLDDYDKITVYIANTYYQGKSRFFWLRDPSGVLTSLHIQKIETTSNDYSKYTLTGFSELHIGASYEIVEEHAMSCVLQYGWIVRTDRFSHEYYTERTDFGAHIIDDGTRFTVWAPTAKEVKLALWIDEHQYIIDMRKEDRGVYSATMKGNLHGAQYQYIVAVNGRIISSLDPYAYGSTANSTHSVVVDFNQFDINFHDDKLPKLRSVTDALICEASVRDFSMDPFSNINHKGTFVAMTQEETVNKFGNPTGFDYLKSLGFTHIQLMPVYDFETVDELNPHVFYNWGYDPVQYNALEGSYSTNPTDPLLRISEFLNLISHYHKHGLRINLDVVYNHVFDLDKSSFESIVPGYYFRRSSEGTISNGSFCGNDFDSTKSMARKFIIDSLTHFVRHYHVDGFRFDLMGILDVDTMNEIVLRLKALRPSIMIYGEGWSMPTMLEEHEKASMYNSVQMPEIAFFNDFYRDHIKGAASADRSWHKGYLTGDLSMIEAAKACLVGTTQDNQVVKLFNEPTQTINYVECHDNYTLWDKIKEACRDDLKIERIARQKAINGFVTLSQGILLMQYGQESCRTKGGIDNSYRSPDEINQIDYERHIQYREVVEYTKDMLALRQEFEIFRFKSHVDIQQHIYFQNLNESILLYGFKDVAKYCEYSDVKVFINPNKFAYEIDLDGEYDLIANEKGRIRNQKVTSADIAPLSILIVGH